MPQRRNELTTMMRSEPFAYVAEYDANGNVEYEAWAAVGASMANSVWIAAKNTYNASNQLTRTKWAKDSNNKTADFTNAAGANDVTSSLSSLTYV